jgi:ACS family allantoate permease-like MFS transporter
MADSDPEKVLDLNRPATYGEGEVEVTEVPKNAMHIHANPNDGDQALKAFIGHEGETIVLTPETERKLLRKIDLNIMPV